MGSHVSGDREFIFHCSELMVCEEKLVMLYNIMLKITCQKLLLFSLEVEEKMYPFLLEKNG